MAFIQRFIERFYPPVHPLPTGTHHLEAVPAEGMPYRLHLRLEPDGNGLLIVNASTILHLNQTAAEYAYHLIKQTPAAEVAKEISKRYQVREDQALKDFNDLKDRLEILIKTPDLDPETFLDFERKDVNSAALSAPLRIDCALTYRQSVAGDAELAPQERVKRELTTEEWISIMDKAWNAGIPHVIFTGGEPTLRPDLPELIAHTEQLGMVAGLLTDGLRLAETDYLHEILQSGLDHVMILFDPESGQSWEALKDVLAEDIFVTLHLTITPRIEDQIPMLMNRLIEMGVCSISLSVSDVSLKPTLDLAAQMAADHQITQVWDLPVPYSAFHPIALELSQAGETPISGAGKAWIYVEPDGDVLPAQGINKVLGCLLTDPWESIWAKAQA